MLWTECSQTRQRELELALADKNWCVCLLEMTITLLNFCPVKNCQACACAKQIWELQGFQVGTQNKDFVRMK